MAPVQTRVVRGAGVPGLGDVDFAIRGPGEGFAGEEPEGRPDARCTGGCDDGGEAAGGFVEVLVGS